MDKFESTPKIKHPTEDTESTNNTNAYLESKLPLFSNLKGHFDNIPNLKEILTSYMSLSWKNKTNLKRDIKNRLVKAGVYNDEQLLEFLLLIAEQKRSFDDRPEGNTSDDKLCKYYFDKYKYNENWAQTDFDFYRQHTNSWQTERSRILEEVAIEMITKSRASLEKTIKPTPKEIAELIEEVNLYF